MTLWGVLNISDIKCFDCKNNSKRTCHDLKYKDESIFLSNIRCRVLLTISGPAYNYIISEHCEYYIISEHGWHQSCGSLPVWASEVPGGGGSLRPLIIFNTVGREQL